MSVRLGEILLKESLITQDQLDKALEFQRSNGGKLGSCLTKMGFITDDDITGVLSRQYGVPSINLKYYEIDPNVIKLIPQDTALRYQVIPLSRVGSVLTIAMTDTTNVFAMDDIKFMTGYNVEPVVASETAVIEAMARFYPAPPKARPAKEEKAIKEEPLAVPSGPSTLEAASKGLEDLQATLEDAGDVEVLEELQEISADALA